MLPFWGILKAMNRAFILLGLLAIVLVAALTPVPLGLLFAIRLLTPGVAAAPPFSAPNYRCTCSQSGAM